mgnify:CR=1 FL=1
MNHLTKVLLLINVIIFCNSVSYSQHGDINPWLSYKLDISSHPTCISIDKKGIIFIGTENGIVIKSEDKGLSWEQIFESYNHDPVSCILISNDGAIYIGVSYPGGCLVVSSGNEGLYKSTNGGRTWNRIIKTIWVNSIIENGDGSIYVCANTFNLETDNYVSKDKGNNWLPINIGLPKEFITEFYLDSFYNLFAINFDGGIYKLNQIKNEWVKINVNLPVKNIGCYLKTLNGTEFISSSDSGLFRSNDNFKTYIKLDFTLSHQISSLLVNSHNEIFAATYGQGIFYSSDYGKSWIEFNQLLFNSRYITAMAFDKKQYLYILGYRYGEENESNDIFDTIRFDLKATDYVLYVTSRSTVEDEPLIK